MTVRRELEAMRKALRKQGFRCTDALGYDQEWHAPTGGEDGYGYDHWVLLSRDPDEWSSPEYEPDLEWSYEWPDGHEVGLGLTTLVALLNRVPR